MSQFCFRAIVREALKIDKNPHFHSRRKGKAKLNEVK